MNTFTRRSLIRAPASIVWDFHASPQSLQKLTPSPIFVKINEDQRISLTEGDLDFTLWFGPLPVRWVARHEPGASPDSFRDRMLLGPMETWIHEHSILAQGDSTILEDRLVYSYPRGWRGVSSRLLFNRFGLCMLFAYRHLRTRIGVRRMRN
ncbi:MAG TPA: SRPBCC family protein [Anaerolineales bacterium]|nr:SRPBCC family protein [Anaerolineales bacterium]